MTDKKIKKLALLGLVIVGIITGNPVNAAAVAEVSASVVASQNDVNSVSRITYERFADSMIVKVVNVKRQDVVSVLWNGSDISSQLKKSEKAGHIVVSDDENGFTVEFDAPNLFENGELGFSLIDKPTVSIIITPNNGNNYDSINKVTVSSSQAGLIGEYILKGTVQYREPTCYFWGCWSKASGASIKIERKKTMFYSALVVNTSTDTNGNYSTDKLLGKGCFPLTITATYKKKSVAKKVDTTCFGTTTVTTDFDIK